jgi:transcriptional regulator with XRE-family HTH domain
LASFSERLKQLREERGLLQRELAETLKLSRVTVTNYEKGKRFPEADLLVKLADHFNVSVDYLIGRDGQEGKERGLSMGNLQSFPEPQALVDKLNPSLQTVRLLEQLNCKAGKIIQLLESHAKTQSFVLALNGPSVPQLSEEDLAAMCAKRVQLMNRQGGCRKTR